MNGRLHSNIDNSDCKLSHGHNTRNFKNLIVPRVNTVKYGVNGVLFRIIKSFNDIPQYVTNVHSYYCFKKTFKN